MALKDWRRTRIASEHIEYQTKKYPPKILDVILSTDKKRWKVINPQAEVIAVTENKTRALAYAMRYMRTH